MLHFVQQDTCLGLLSSTWPPPANGIGIMASVTVENVVKYYDTADAVSLSGAHTRPPALANVSLQLDDGETVSVIGASGCGKSTLLKVVAGLERPDRGRLLFADVDVTALPPQERGVGMVFQDYAVYPTMKGKGN